MILIDTNVVLDFLLNREPFSDDAAKIFGKVESGHLVSAVSSVSLTTVWYVVTKKSNVATARRGVMLLTQICEVATVGRAEIDSALDAVADRTFTDFEDAVQHAAAETAGAGAIITRNVGDFVRARLAVLTPAQLLAQA